MYFTRDFHGSKEYSFDNLVVYQMNWLKAADEYRELTMHNKKWL
jgi:hypothetical protein